MITTIKTKNSSSASRSPTYLPVEGGMLGCEARDMEYLSKK